MPGSEAQMRTAVERHSTNQEVSSFHFHSRDTRERESDYFRACITYCRIWIIEARAKLNKVSDLVQRNSSVP